MPSYEAIPWAMRSLPSSTSDPLPADIKARFQPDINASFISQTQCTSNPTLMNKPFWKYMIAKGADAYSARKMLDIRDIGYNAPMWCFDRFGMSTTWLPDGRIVFIGGEHEDFYDPDFFIYNDVVVVQPATEPETVDVWTVVEREPDDYRFGTNTDGSLSYTVTTKQVWLPRKRILPPKPDEITVYGYPRTVFPPTDFHIAVYVGGHAEEDGAGFIYVIGGVGYRAGDWCVHRDGTAVFRLDLESFRMEKVATTGEAPPHNADSVKKRRAYLRGREIVTQETEDGDIYALNLDTMVWKRLTGEEIFEPEPELEVCQPGDSDIHCRKEAWKVSEDLEKGYI
ncbi:hypothetical protein B0H66DRAFT_552413 [Apodospora peruviana]|uniref:Uncharacterized protein n=1 Tax=Apodospora peruviana TaxID=516989 RepID=A0AAE0IBJ3_9PEZI|nr:hypothetical protein B0H66DRAFT_552413 [Apodospora peruviana]